MRGDLRRMIRAFVMPGRGDRLTRATTAREALKLAGQRNRLTEAGSSRPTTPRTSAGECLRSRHFPRDLREVKSSQALQYLLSGGGKGGGVTDLVLSHMTSRGDWSKNLAELMGIVPLPCSRF